MVHSFFKKTELSKNRVKPQKNLATNFQLMIGFYSPVWNERRLEEEEEKQLNIVVGWGIDG